MCLRPILISPPLMTEPSSLTALITADDIAKHIEVLADQISVKVDSDWTLIALMDGALVFAADILRALYVRGINPEFENMTLSSYGDDIQSTGEVTVQKGLTRDISGKSVLLIDDVFETGLTLHEASKIILAAGASEVKTCVFAYKSGYSENLPVPDFKAWAAPDAFLVGYGMDFKGRYRGLPYIADLLEA